MARRPLSWPRIVAALLGAAAGFALLTVAGAFVLRWALEQTGASSGWEDLASAAAALFTFGPLGAVSGAAMVLGGDLGPDQRRWLLAASFTALAAGVVTWFALDVLWGAAVFLWAVTLAVLIWLVGALRAG